MPEVQMLSLASEVNRGIAGSADQRTLQFIVHLDEPADNPDVLLLDYVDSNLSSPGVIEPNKVPAEWDNMPLAQTSVSQLGPMWMLLSVQYSRMPFAGYVRGKVGEVEVSFSVQAENTEVRIANAQDGYSIDSADDPVTGLYAHEFINVRKTSSGIDIEGASARRPVQTFKVTLTEDETFFTEGYLATVTAHVGKVNENTWRGYQQGEVMFMGIAGSVNNTGESRLTFEYERRPTIQGPTEIAGVTINRDILGFEKIWPLYTTRVAEPGTIAPNAKIIYVYQDFEFSDFNGLP